MGLWTPKFLVVACAKTLSSRFFCTVFSKFSPVALVEGTEMSLWTPKCLVIVCVKNLIWKAFLLSFFTKIFFYTIRLLSISWCFLKKVCWNRLKNKHFTIFRIFTTSAEKGHFHVKTPPKHRNFKILIPLLFYIIHTIIPDFIVKFGCSRYKNKDFRPPKPHFSEVSVMYAEWYFGDSDVT